MSNEVVNKLYDKLELSYGASIDEVRQKYRDLIFVWHPDRFPGNSRLQADAEAKTRELNNAYDSLIAYLKGDNAPFHQFSSNSTNNDELSNMSEIGTLYRVDIGDKFGFINCKGEMVIPAKYTFDDDGIDFFDKYAVVNNGSCDIIINSSDEVVYTDVSGNGIKGNEYSGFFIGGYGEYRLLDASFNECSQVFNSVYTGDVTDLELIPNGYNETLIQYQLNNKYGIIDLSGNIIIKADYSGIRISNHVIHMENENGDCTVIRRDNFNTIKLPSSLKHSAYTEYNYTDNEYTVPVINTCTNKIGVVDLDGNLIIDTVYDEAYAFSEGLVKCIKRKSEKHMVDVHFVNTKNITVMKFSCNLSTGEDFRYVGGPWWWKNNVRCSSGFSSGLCSFVKATKRPFWSSAQYKSGWIDANGHEKIILFNDSSDIMEESSRFIDGKSIVKIKDSNNKYRYCVVNSSGAYIVDDKYDDIYRLKNSMFRCTMGSSTVFYDGDGNMLKLKL